MPVLLEAAPEELLLPDPPLALEPEALEPEAPDPVAVPLLVESLVPDSSDDTQKPRWQIAFGSQQPEASKHQALSSIGVRHWAVQVNSPISPSS